MKSIIASCAIVGAIVATPVYAQSGGDPVSELAQELNLTQEQIQTMRDIFSQFAQKQEQVPMPGQVVLDNRSELKGIITSENFDRKKAKAFVEKVTAVIEEATLNRLELRHDLYRQLNAEQKAQYLGMVQEKAAELMQ
jgi:Spy/CpxP family protein refolding chaperone